MGIMENAGKTERGQSAAGANVQEGGGCHSLWGDNVQEGGGCHSPLGDNAQGGGGCPEHSLSRGKTSPKMIVNSVKTW